MCVCAASNFTVCAATWRTTLTTVARRLEAVLGEGAPADREDVPGVELAPVIEGPTPAIKHNEDLVTLHFSDGGWADEVRVLLVHSLQLHAGLKVVLTGPQRFLEPVQHPQCRNSEMHVLTMTFIFRVFGITYFFKSCCWCHLCSI